MDKDRSGSAVSRREAIAASLLAAGGMVLGGGGRVARGQQASIVTAPAKPLRIAHLTDMHVQPERRAAEGFASALRSLSTLNPQPDFIVTGGDHVFDTLSQPLDRVRAQWDLYHKVLAENTKLPVHPVLGNHDVWGWANPEAISADAPNYGKAMGLDRLGMAKSYYSFDAGAWQVIVLDSMTQRGKKYFGALGPEQTEWLKGELQAIGPTKPIVVFSHIPVLAVCPFFGREERLGETEWNVPDQAMHHDARELVDLFDQYNVRLLVSGHIHLVDRVEYRGMTFICDGSISGNWWKGPRLQFPEGYGVFDLHPDGRFEHRYVTYGWKAKET